LISLYRHGSSLNVLGPLGRGFDYSGIKDPLILVAGGMGIAPLLGLGWSLKIPFQLLIGYRSASEILPLEDMGFTDFDTRISTEDGSHGHKGLVTDLLSNPSPPSSEPNETVFACGPQGMLKQVATWARKRDIPCQVSLEANMACGLGACQGCAVRAADEGVRPYLHVCSDGPVFRAEELYWEHDRQNE
jgi:dihydroorotate dehydrogenase electron transfer subunit